MGSNINNNCTGISHVIIDNAKNIISYNLEGIDDISLLLNKTPQKGQNFVDIFPGEQALYVSEIVDKCLAGHVIMADQSLVKSSLKIQVLFISISVNEDMRYAVCLFMPDCCQQTEVLSLNDYLRFASHELRAPVSNILSLSDFENYSRLKSSDNLRIKELLKDIYNQAEKLNNIIAVFNNLMYTAGDFKENTYCEKIIGDHTHIVLVDDDLLVNKMHKMILLKYKKDVVIKDFDNPENALEYIYSNKPDLIFLDINMPVIDGWMFLQRLEAYPFDLSVIVVSSSIDPNEMVRAHSYKRVRKFIVKPLTREKLDPLFIDFNEIIR
jgi:CheY-like chemotaxis protein